MTRCTVTDLSAVLERAGAIEQGMFRLETLQFYDVSYELQAYRAFLDARTVDLTPGPWQELIRRHAAAGRACRRVHVVREPLTSYLRYELAAPYARSAAAGERIGILVAAPGRWPDGVPSYDYWLFDDELWVMRYDHVGRFVAIEVDDDRSTVAEHRHAAEVAIAAATPVTEYWLRHRLSR
jgi:hypothetical protein